MDNKYLKTFKIKKQNLNPLNLKFMNLKSNKLNKTVKLLKYSKLALVNTMVTINSSTNKTNLYEKNIFDRKFSFKLSESKSINKNILKETNNEEYWENLIEQVNKSKIKNINLITDKTNKLWKKCNIYSNNIVKQFKQLFYEIWDDFLKNNEHNKKFLLRKENNKIFNTFNSLLEIQINIFLNEYIYNFYNNFLINIEIERNISYYYFDNDKNDNSNLSLWNQYKNLLWENYKLNLELNITNKNIISENLLIVKNYKEKFQEHCISNLDELKVKFIEKPDILDDLFIYWKKYLINFWK